MHRLGVAPGMRFEQVYGVRSTAALFGRYI